MRPVDPAGTLAKLLAAMDGKQSGKLNVAIICRVLAYNMATCKATVQPLIRTGQDDPAPIQSVIALGQRIEVDGTEQSYKPVLRTGDVVFVVFADYEIKNGLTGSVSSPDTARQHDKNDGVIVGIFPASL